MRPKYSPRTPRRKPKYNPKIGDQFGTLTVLGSPLSRGGTRFVQVRCDCGRSFEHRVTTLYTVRRPGCGCQRGPVRLIDWGGRTNTLTGWAAEIGITASGLARRLKSWPLDRALSLGHRERE